MTFKNDNFFSCGKSTLLSLFTDETDVSTFIVDHIFQNDRESDAYSTFMKYKTSTYSHGERSNPCLCALDFLITIVNTNASFY